MTIIRMRKAIGCLVLVVPMVLAQGCASMSNTDKGVVAGTGIGAGTGALIGSTTGHTGAGAVAGGLIGGISGFLFGNALDNAERRAEARAVAAQAPPPPPPLGMTDIVKMSYQQVSDDIIISEIRSTGSVYHLSPQDIIWLRENRVSNAVIREMKDTAYRPARRVFSPTPVVPVVRERVVVVEPPPPPGVSVGVGYTWYGGRCR